MINSEYEIVGQYRFQKTWKNTVKETLGRSLLLILNFANEKMESDSFMPVKHRTRSHVLQISVYPDSEGAYQKHPEEKGKECHVPTTVPDTCQLTPEKPVQCLPQTLGRFGIMTQTEALPIGVLEKAIRPHYSLEAI